MSYSPGRAFAAGWGVVRGRYRVMLEASILYAIAQVVIVILQQLSGTADDAFSLEQLLSQALTTVGVSIPAAAGFAWMGVTAQRPGPVPLSSFFSGYRRWATLIAVWFLEAAAALAVLVPALLLTGLLFAQWGLEGGFDSIRGGAMGIGAFVTIWAAAAVGTMDTLGRSAPVDARITASISSQPRLNSSPPTSAICPTAIGDLLTFP